MAVCVTKYTSGMSARKYLHTPACSAYTKSKWQFLAALTVIRKVLRE